MRSYTKIAQEKGWIQEETIKKEASAPDYQPTGNLMENVLKLCRGLRQTGFDKYAEELESKFVQFKQADCHYDVSGEKGEDLVHAAHPEGSHKLVDVEGDSVVETILDQHMKILEKILKMPHGKLSTSAEIIDAVKVVLATNTLEDKLRSLMQQVRQTVQKIVNTAEPELTVSISGGRGATGSFQNHFDELSFDPTTDHLNEMMTLHSRLQYRLQPGTALGITKSTWLGKVKPQMNFLKELIGDAKQVRNQIDEKLGAEESASLQKELISPEPKIESGISGSSDVERAMSLINNYLSDLERWRSRIAQDTDITEEQKKPAFTWIDEKKKAIGNLKRLETMSPEEQANGAARVLKNWPTISLEAADFKKKWIG
jgi:hypothetical protein